MARSGVSMAPFHSASNVATEPSVMMPMTMRPPESNTGAQNAAMPGSSVFTTRAQR